MKEKKGRGRPRMMSSDGERRLQQIEILFLTSLLTDFAKSFRLKTFRSIRCLQVSTNTRKCDFEKQNTIQKT